MILVVAAPPVIEPGETPPRVESGPSTEALSWVINAPWLGRTFTLTDLGSSVIKLRGAKGIGQVDPSHWWSEAPQVHGSSWEGFRINRGQVFIPLQVTGVDSADYLINHESFVECLDPAQEVLLRIYRPDGQWREIGCRYESGADQDLVLDPVKACRSVYGITWATADPYWRGAEISLEFSNEPQTSFFPGPPFTLKSGKSISSATVTNPGNVESYAMWRVVAPFAGFSVGVGNSVVTMGLSKDTGYIDIDTTPRKLTIVDEAGMDRWGDVTDVSFASIPPGDTVLATDITSPGVGTAVRLAFTPRYRRAL